MLARGGHRGQRVLVEPRFAPVAGAVIFGPPAALLVDHHRGHRPTLGQPAQPLRVGDRRGKRLEPQEHHRDRAPQPISGRVHLASRPVPHVDERTFYPARRTPVERQQIDLPVVPRDPCFGPVPRPGVQLELFQRRVLHAVRFELLPYVVHRLPLPFRGRPALADLVAQAAQVRADARAGPRLAHDPAVDAPPVQLHRSPPNEFTRTKPRRKNAARIRLARAV